MTPEARVRRRLTWRFEEDGSLSGAFRLPPLAGAVLLRALRAACADLAGLPAGVSAETPAAMETPAAAETPATAGTPDAADSPDAGGGRAGPGRRTPAGGPDVVGSG